MGIYDNLNITDFYDEDELIWELVEMSDNGRDKDYNSVCLFAKNELIYYVFTELIKCNIFEIGLIDFSRDYYDADYDNIYCLHIYDNQYISIEKAYNINENSEFYGRPYAFEGKAYVFQDDVNQDLIDYLLRTNEDVTLFGFEEECDEDCDHCELFCCFSTKEEPKEEIKAEPKTEKEDPSISEQISNLYKDGKTDIKFSMDDLLSDDLEVMFENINKLQKLFDLLNK